MSSVNGLTFEIWEIVVATLFLLTISGIIVGISNTDKIKADLTIKEIEASTILLPKNTQTTINIQEPLTAITSKNSIQLKYEVEEDGKKTKKVTSNSNIEYKSQANTITIIKN